MQVYREASVCFKLPSPSSFSILTRLAGSYSLINRSRKPWIKGMVSARLALSSNGDSVNGIILIMPEEQSKEAVLVLMIITSFRTQVSGFGLTVKARYT